MIVASELEAPIRVTSGPAIQHAGDLASILSSLSEGEVLFLDEIHRMARPAEEMLYLAMEDFRVDIVVGKGPGATAIPLELAPFTVVGATTRAGLLPAPLRDRFGFTGHLDFYSTQDLQTILRRSAGLLKVEATDEGIAQIAGRSRGTPRIANRLLRRVPTVRRGAGRPVDPGGRRRRGAGHRRDGRRALPRPRRLPRADPPRASGDSPRLVAPGPHPARGNAGAAWRRSRPGGSGVDGGPGAASPRRRPRLDPRRSRLILPEPGTCVRPVPSTALSPTRAD